MVCVWLSMLNLERRRHRWLDRRDRKRRQLFQDATCPRCERWSRHCRQTRSGRIWRKPTRSRCWWCCRVNTLPAPAQLPWSLNIATMLVVPINRAGGSIHVVHNSMPSTLHPPFLRQCESRSFDLRNFFCNKFSVVFGYRNKMVLL